MLVQMHRYIIKNITYAYVYVRKFYLIFCADVCQLEMEVKYYGNYKE
jgi:hypothetical protein